VVRIERTVRRRFARKLAGVTIGALSVLGTSAHAQVTFTVTATADATAAGYESGSSYTFEFTTGPSYPTHDTLVDSVFLAGSQNFWVESYTSDSQLFVSAGGTGLDGVFVRPAADAAAPYSFVQVIPNQVSLRLDSDAATNNGLRTLDGTDFRGLFAALTPVGLVDPILGAVYVDPTAWWASHAGSYGVGGTVGIRDVDYAYLATFTATQLEVSLVPEPSASGALAGCAALRLLCWRRRRAAH